MLLPAHHFEKLLNALVIIEGEAVNKLAMFATLESVGFVG